MFKRVLAGVFLFLLVGITVFLLNAAFRPEALPIGSMMPRVSYRSAYGRATLAPDSVQNMIVVHFHTGCKYCRYQLKLFDENLGAMVGTRLVLLTTEKDLFEKEKLKLWPQLGNSTKVSWGIIDAKMLGEYFGSLRTPSMFFFDRSGRLGKRIRGEVRLERILAELASLGAQEQPVSSRH